MRSEADAQYRVVALFYEVAFLDSRRRAGLELTPDEEERLTVLIAALGGDPGWVRRRFRRRMMMLPAVVKGRGIARATILNMSPDGMLVAAPLEVSEGDSVLVKIGRPGSDSAQRSFPCRVVRTERRGEASLIALALSGIPLEVRYGSYPTAERSSQPLQIRKTG